MKLALFIGACLLAGLASAAPTSEDDKVLVTKEFFPDEFVKYTAEHDIVNILVPLNALNFGDDDDDSDEESDTTYVFFIEADVGTDGKRVDQGAYVMKNTEVTKLLDHGRDVSAANDETKAVYIGAKDGIYVYDVEKNKAEKYGIVTDSIISIAKVNGSDVIYILTEDHVLYKVAKDGTEKTKVDEVVNAQQIVLDYENNLYYYTPEKEVYVYSNGAVKKIEGLPSATFINVLKPPFIIENGVPLVVDNKAYIAYVNGSSEFSDFELVAKPTAYAMEATLIQYFAYNKKIYEYNLLEIVLSEMVSELKSLLDDKTESIQAIATRSRGTLKKSTETSTGKP